MDRNGWGKGYEARRAYCGQWAVKGPRVAVQRLYWGRLCQVSQPLAATTDSHPTSLLLHRRQHHPTAASSMPHRPTISAYSSLVAGVQLTTLLPPPGAPAGGAGAGARRALAVLDLAAALCHPNHQGVGLTPTVGSATKAAANDAIVQILSAPITSLVGPSEVGILGLV